MSEHYSSTDPRGDDRVDPETYGRFLAGEATDDDRRVLERWATTPRRRRLLDAKHDVARPHRDRTNQAWSRLRERIALAGSVGAGAGGQLAPHGRSGMGRRAWRRDGGDQRWGTVSRRAYALAAVAVVACGLIVSGHPSRLGWLRPASATGRVFATGAAQRAVVTLDDGTRVVLDAGTRLHVTPDLATGRRLDLLDGQAQFTVTHRRAEPFVVRAGAAQVTVLGTTFTIRRSAADGRSRVVVVDGRVALRLLRRGGRGDVVLGAGMLGEVADTGGAPVVTPDVDVNDYTAWTRGRLVFHDTPLRRAIPELERRYGLVIRLADSSLGEQPISATMGDAPAGDVLDLIAMSFDMRYTREGNTVTFFRAPQNPTRARRASPLHPETTYGK